MSDEYEHGYDDGYASLREKIDQLGATALEWKARAENLEARILTACSYEDGYRDVRDVFDDLWSAALKEQGQ